MLNRDQIAHEYAKVILSQNRTLEIEDIPIISFEIADAMIAEAEKRKNVETPRFWAINSIKYQPLATTT